LAKENVVTLRMLGSLAMVWATAAWAQPNDGALYKFQSGQQTRWVSPENPTGAKGEGGKENKGAKGHAFDTIPVGKSLVLADIKGAGIIDRMWITIEDRSPDALRGLKLDITWDGAKSPAVSVRW
jgi:hypothetical protein